MLKITIHHEATAVRLQVEGKLAGPWVNELKTCWNSIASGCGLLVDLSATTLIDAEGKALLAEMHRRGARLVATGLMTQAIITELTEETNV